MVWIFRQLTKWTKGAWLIIKVTKHVIAPYAPTYFIGAHPCSIEAEELCGGITIINGFGVILDVLRVFEDDFKPQRQFELLRSECKDAPWIYQNEGSLDCRRRVWESYCSLSCLADCMVWGEILAINPQVLHDAARKAGCF